MRSQISGRARNRRRRRWDRRLDSQRSEPKSSEFGFLGLIRLDVHKVHRIRNCVHGFIVQYPACSEISWRKGRTLWYPACPRLRCLDLDSRETTADVAARLARHRLFCPAGLSGGSRRTLCSALLVCGCFVRSQSLGRKARHCRRGGSACLPTKSRQAYGRAVLAMLFCKTRRSRNTNFVQ